jgi:hypothetical protein
MPKRNNRHPLISAAVLGIGLLGGATLYAEYPRDMGQAHTLGNDETRVRNTDLTGGFYEDRYKLDDWYYDFYDSPGATRTSSGSMDQTSYGEPGNMADAAHPWVLRHRIRSEQAGTYQQYYDEPWFYDQRDPVYGMPETGREAFAPSDNVIKGTIKATKQVRNRSTGDQNTVALVTTADGRQVTTDLGPTRRTMDMALTQGDQIQVAGQWEDVGPYSVLMAQQIKAGTNRVNLHREAGPTMVDRKVEGRIQQFRDIRTNNGAELHRTAAVQTPDGRFAIVDLGADSRDQALTRAATGDRMVARGRVIQVGNYPVLLANQVAINDGTPVHIARPTESGAFSPETGRSPDCVGGGCDNQSLNRAQPREPHSNAMDGTVR